MGRGAPAFRYPRQRRCAGRGDDSHVPTMARRFSECRGEAWAYRLANSSREADDGAGRNRFRRGVPDLLQIRPYHRPTRFRGRRVRASGSRGHLGAKMNARRIPLTNRQYAVPLTLITSLFFLWALGVNLNDILIPHLKKAFRLTDLQSSLIQTAFFGGYFLAALPAGWLMGRIGYKKGILAGLLICSAGALLFIPAASVLAYGFFLFALFVMACGQSFLEVAANPYVTVLGPAGSAERRLNLCQSFNSVGAVVTPVIGAAFILTNTRGGSAGEADTVKMPYLVIAGIFLAVAVMVRFTHLPEIAAERAHEDSLPSQPKLRDALRHPHLVRGVVAQFL